MGVPIVTTTPGRRNWPRWRRRRLRAWARREVAGSIPSILTTIPSFSRAELARLPHHRPVARHTRTAGFTRVHRLEDSHTLSADYGQNFWLPIFRRAFPTLMSAVAIEQDGWAQRAGIDWLLTLACGRAFTVDEKIHTEDWPDVLL